MRLMPPNASKTLRMSSSERSGWIEAIYRRLCCRGRGTTQCRVSALSIAYVGARHRKKKIGCLESCLESFSREDLSVLKARGHVVGPVDFERATAERHVFHLLQRQERCFGRIVLHEAKAL